MKSNKENMLPRVWGKLAPERPLMCRSGSPHGLRVSFSFPRGRQVAPCQFQLEFHLGLLPYFLHNPTCKPVASSFASINKALETLCGESTLPFQRLWGVLDFNRGNSHRRDVSTETIAPGNIYLVILAFHHIHENGRDVHGRGKGHQ